MFCSFTTIMEINKEFLGKLFEQAVVNPRLRQNWICEHLAMIIRNAC